MESSHLLTLKMPKRKSRSFDPKDLELRSSVLSNDCMCVCTYRHVREELQLLTSTATRVDVAGFVHSEGTECSPQYGALKRKLLTISS